MRKLYLILLMPLLMLFVQQGAMRHELGHLAQSSQAGHQKQHPGGTVCDTCLNFAHIAASAKPNVPMLWLTTQLRHHQVATVWAHITETIAPAPRSRGPPNIF